MSRVTIKLVKKILLLEETTFKNSNVIYSKTNNFINEKINGINGINGINQLYKVKYESPEKYYNFIKTVKTEVEYYVNEIKHIPYLSDSLSKVQIENGGFFLDIDTPNNLQDSVKNISIFFISPEFELLENFGDKILIRPYDGIKNDPPFIVELNNTTGIYSYSEVLK